MSEYWAHLIRHLLLWSVLLLLTLALVYWRLGIARAGEPWDFARPSALWLCGVGVLVLALGLSGRPRQASFWVSQPVKVGAYRLGIVARYSKAPVVIRSVALVLVALALARPQTLVRSETISEGVDLMFVLDLSKSMEEQDLEENRLDAGQRTIREFLRKRQGKGDRIGLVVFAKEAMLQCPLTLDYRSLDSIVAGLQIGDVPPLGTAIGDALGLALASLSRGGASSKVVILLSDGDWNKAHYMAPSEAQELSVAMQVRVFTVLLGQESSGAGIQRDAQMQYAVNPTVLKELASETGGLYFNATDNWELNHSFEEIRKRLQMSEAVEQGTRSGGTLYWLFLWPALGLLLLELVLRSTRFRSFP